MNLGYRYALDEVCCQVFSALPLRERERLLSVFRQLAADPFQKGEYREADSRGFAVEVKLAGDHFLITWHTDHAAKEVRIVGLDIV